MGLVKGIEGKNGCLLMFFATQAKISTNFMRSMPMLLLSLALLRIEPAVAAQTDSDACAGAEINTDRPGVSNSSEVVPTGRLQFESGVDWTQSHGAGSLDAPNSRLRLGIGNCSEILIDAFDYFVPTTHDGPRGSSDLVFSLKHEFKYLAPGLIVATTLGSSFPTGAGDSSAAYQPYFQTPWSYDLPGNALAGWSANGMFTFTWTSTRAPEHPAVQTTLAVQKQLPIAFNLRLFAEYAGSCADHQAPQHLLDGGAMLPIGDSQQLDFQAGFGLNTHSVGHFVGLGYSFKLDFLQP